MIKTVSHTLTARNWPLLALLISLSLWLGALGFQHIGGMQPCQMCYWQRHAHKAVLIIAVLALLTRQTIVDKKWERCFLILLGLAFIVSFGLAFWHAGVEYKWWAGPRSCSGEAVVINAADILKALETPVKMPACGDVPWSLLGISMAGYNAIISLGAALMSFYFVAQKK